MVDTDTPAFVAMLREVFGLYPSAKPLAEGQVAMFFRALQQYPMEAVRAALDAHVRDAERGRYAPVPADVISKIEGNADELALIAWGRVIAAAKAGGACFEGPAQAALDSMGGMARVRFAREDENGFLQRQFCAAFKAYRSAEGAPPLLACEVIKHISAERHL
jgi:hypothetical protein